MRKFQSLKNWKGSFGEGEDRQGKKRKMFLQLVVFGVQLGKMMNFFVSHSWIGLVLFGANNFHIQCNFVFVIFVTMKTKDKRGFWEC